MRDNGERSYITFQAYLNDGFEGGCTTFLNNSVWEKDKTTVEDVKYEVVPRKGSVLIFQHDMLHEGSELLSGRKYSVRTDVMYAATGTYIIRTIYEAFPQILFHFQVNET